MLTKLYRFGASRQSIVKGFVVASSERSSDAPASVVERLCAPESASQTLARSRGMAVRADHGASHSIGVDTGPIWLHSAAARAAGLDAMNEIVASLVNEARAEGGLLLPNAVRLGGSGNWQPFLCGDRHTLETCSDVEKGAICNLLRVHLPALIALTGRAGIGPQGVEAVGSRRLCDSDQHLAARPFASVSPRYLAHLRRTLLRDDGVKRLELLDVNPDSEAAQDGMGAGTGGHAVSLRFVDGQILPRTTFAHALLFQALLIRARRMLGTGRSIRNPSQRQFEQQRSLAIAHGLGAALASDTAPSVDGRPTQGSAPRGADQAKVQARRLVLELFEDLRVELASLETSYDELAPLVLGPSLRAAGTMGVENERDLVQDALAREQGNPERYLVVIERLWARPSPGDGPFADPVTTFNERQFPAESRTIRQAWEDLLVPPQQQEAVASSRQASGGVAR